MTSKGQKMRSKANPRSLTFILDPQPADDWPVEPEMPKGKAVLYALDQPAEVEIDEVVLRPTVQDF